VAGVERGVHSGTQVIRGRESACHQPADPGEKTITSSETAVGLRRKTIGYVLMDLAESVPQVEPLAGTWSLPPRMMWSVPNVVRHVGL
jgi:hypothetical protein